jgi:hypothetical protein
MTASIEQAILRFNEMNAQDPNQVMHEGKEVPRELLSAERLEAWVHKLEPSPSVALRLAARCQHLKRFSVPRSDYPEGRIGYLKWRKDLSRRHADLAAEVLSDLGFTEDVISEVRAINQKEGLRTNPDTQTMEDALCLSFLEHEFSAFAEKHEDDKVIDIVQKTWRKMSERGHALALTLPLGGRAKDLVGRALS